MSGIGDGLPAWWKPKNGYRDKTEAQRAKSVDGDFFRLTVPRVCLCKHCVDEITIMIIYRFIFIPVSLSYWVSIYSFALSFSSPGSSMSLTSPAASLR